MNIINIKRDVEEDMYLNSTISIIENEDKYKLTGIHIIYLDWVDEIKNTLKSSSRYNAIDNVDEIINFLFILATSTTHGSTERLHAMYDLGIICDIGDTRFSKFIKILGLLVSHIEESLEKTIAKFINLNNKTLMLCSMEHVMCYPKDIVVFNSVHIDKRIHTGILTVKEFTLR